MYNIRILMEKYNCKYIDHRSLAFEKADVHMNGIFVKQFSSIKCL